MPLLTFSSGDALYKLTKIQSSVAFYHTGNPCLPKMSLFDAQAL